MADKRCETCAEVGIDLPADTERGGRAVCGDCAAEIDNDLARPDSL